MSVTSEKRSGPVPSKEAVDAALAEYERERDLKCPPGEEARVVVLEMLRAAYAIDGA